MAKINYKDLDGLLKFAVFGAIVQASAVVLVLGVILFGLLMSLFV